MPFFSNFSIRTKLALVMTAILALISIANFIAMPEWLKRQSLNALTQKAGALGDMSAVTLAPHLEEQDRPAVAEALIAVRRNPDLVFLVVEDAKGKRFATFSELIAAEVDFAHLPMAPIGEGSLLYPHSDASLRATEGALTPDGEIFITRTPILWLGKLVGTLYVGYTTARVREDFTRSRATIAIVTLFAFGVGVALVFALSTVVTGPLSRIAGITQKIAEGELEQRADASTGDEVGQLARSFNLMIDRIAAERWKLASLNRDLELRVDERTREVTEQFEERKRAQERYRLLFDRNLAGVYIATTDFTVVSCNDACAQIFGYNSADEFLEEHGTIAYAYDHDRDAILRRLHAEGIVTNEEVELRGRDGRSVWALENARLIQSASGATLEGILLDVSDRKRAEEEIAYRAYHDPLTDLPNRALFLDRLTVAIAQAERQERQLAVLFLDVDDLKMVNDTLGHGTGDDLLNRLARRLTEIVRRADTVARVGGDEFVILLPDIREQDASAIAQKILDRLAAPFVVNGEELHITASIGVSLYPADGVDAEALIRTADGAMYRVKEKGGNQFQLSSRLASRTLGRTSLEQELRAAIERDEFLVYYQPQVSLSTGDLSGMEALVRWQTADDTLVEPGAFIPIAEHTGLIGPIGALVLKKSCEQYAAWQRAGFTLPRIGINVSARQFFQPDFAGMLERSIAGACVDPSFIELEITESVAMQKTEHGIRMLRRLRDLGITIAIDDFGTGQASFSYLKRFPVDTVKIDKSFVRELAPEKSCDKSIVMAILLIARELDLKTVAEGVEKAEQRDFLRDHGCDAMQGYLISRPVPAIAFETLFLKSGPSKLDVAAIAGVR